jgi:hypothetical protein
MPDQLHWDTRLEVKVDGDTVSPIDSITPTFNVPIQVLHSVEADNVGYVVQPQTFTFTMTVKAIGPTVAKLTDIARSRTKFNVAIAERKGHDWSFNSIAFSECLITSVNPSNVVIDGVPTASFNCISLGIETEKA